MKKPSEKWTLLAKELHNQNKTSPVRSFRSILSLSHLVGKYLDIKLTDGVNRTQRMIVLMILSKCGFLTPTELSRLTLRTIDAVNKSIDNLDKSGLTKSYRSKTDRRIRQVTLTEKGLDLAEKSLPDRYLAFSQAMDCFSKEEAMIFQSLLKRLVNHIFDITKKEYLESNKPFSFTSSDEF